jgi:hypothetical protein
VKPTSKIIASLIRVRERLLVRGEYDEQGADVVDATTVQEAIEALSSREPSAQPTPSACRYCGCHGGHMDNCTAPWLARPKYPIRAEDLKP